jgi:hypothetical protein
MRAATSISVNAKYPLLHEFARVDGGWHSIPLATIVDPKIQTTSLVRLGRGLKGGRDGEKTGQAQC